MNKGAVATTLRSGLNASLCILLVGLTSGTLIPVENPSFEDGYLLADGQITGAHIDPIPHWDYAYAAWGAGLINPGSADLQAAECQNVLWSNGGLVTQTLAAVVVPGAYTLSVDVASLAGGEPAFAETAYTLELLVNGSPVGSAVLPPLSASAWQEATITAEFDPGDTEVGGTFGIRMGAAGPQAWFDNVVLSYIAPEAPSLILLVTGTLAMLWHRR